MTDQATAKVTLSAPSSTPASAEATAAADALAERRLMRRVAVGLPAITLGGAVLALALVGIGPAILVLAGGSLLGVIMLFWSSLRTLSGDAPLAPELVEAMALRRVRNDSRSEDKRMALRGLKDLELEHAVGKIDDADYEKMAATLRAQAKQILREMDDALGPQRAKAEELVIAHLKKRGLSGSGAKDVAANATDADAAAEGAAATRADSGTASRLQCPKCGASNEPDATFCKSCGTNVRIEGEKAVDGSAS